VRERQWLRAEVEALKNAGDLSGAPDLASEKAGVGYQAAAGPINGERHAPERPNTAIQQHVPHRQAKPAPEPELSSPMPSALSTSSA